MGRFRASLLGSTLAICLLFGTTISHAYLSDRKVHTPPRYYTFLPPREGKSYIDPVFGTRVRRVSDARRRAAESGRGIPGWITHEYSTISPFSEDDRHLLLIHQTHFALYTGGGRYVRDLPEEIDALSQPRWSRREPDVFYYVNGSDLRKHDVSTGTSAVVHSFGEYSRISGYGESDISQDGDHLVFVGDNRDVFVYTISTDVKGAILDTSGLGGFDQVYVTPDNNVLIGWYAVGEDRYQGVELYDREMRFIRKITRAIGHMDVTRDVDGSESLLWVNGGDPASLCPNSIVKIRLRDGVPTCLITFDYGLALHLSAPDDARWFFVSTYAPDDPTPFGAWPTYTCEILQISLDGSSVRRLVHHRSRPFNDYDYQPRASSNRRGTRLVYDSNYGLQTRAGYPPDYSDVFMITRLRFPCAGRDAIPCGSPNRATKSR